MYSQSGEDGVIAQALGLLPERDNWCVEFGAYDAKSLSNTRNLIENYGYSAVLIEGSKDRFVSLEREYEQSQKVTTVNANVGWSKDDCLDMLLGELPVPQNLDFLSVDIDGNDFHVWEATVAFRPKLVFIEFNPTIPTEVRFVQPRSPSVNQGSSLLSLTELGRTKNYELISVLQFNALFVDAPYFPLFQIEDNDPNVLRKDLQNITHFFTGYDGTVHLAGSRTLPWHEIALREAQMQVLPRRLQKYPHNYNRLERLLFAFYLLNSSPAELLARLKRRRFRRRAKS